jgi:hypothetical protein
MNILLFLIALALILFLNEDIFKKEPDAEKSQKTALKFSTNPIDKKGSEV